MLPLILGAVALGTGALYLMSSGHDNSKPVPPAVVHQVAAAIKTGDPAVMRDVARVVRKAGYSAQATSLEDAAAELEAAIAATPETLAGRTSQLVNGRGRLNPAPRADSTAARRQAGQVAQLLANMTLAEGRASSAVKAAVTDFQVLERSRGFYVGNLDGLYGPKAALALAQDHGIVPPHPLFWPKRDPKGAKVTYQAQLARFADADPQRREEWQQAMHVDND